MGQVHDGGQRARGRLRQAAALVRAALADAVPEEVGPALAVDLAEALGSLEKLVAAALVRYARATGADAAGVAAGSSGIAKGAARRRIETASQVEAVPLVDAAFRAGELSCDQAAVIAPAATAVPASAGSLLELARGSSITELRREAERTLRRARQESEEVANERRIHARRFCRVTTPPGGGVRIDALLTTVEGARLVAALEKETDAVFKEQWAAGTTEPRERLCADALVRLVTGHAASAGAHLVVRVDAGALVRGEVEEGEVCEVDGVGPVSVASARALLGEGFLTLLVKEGTDITTVTSTTRTIPKKLAVALAERDPTCVVPGCGATARLEIDHWRLDFARHGPTELDNLCRLCPTHHRMKTKDGWRLGGGPGQWVWVAPPDRPRRH